MFNRLVWYGRFTHSKLFRKMPENSYLVVPLAVVVSVEVGGMDDVGGEPPK